jgi:hypothetical protein
MTFVSSHLYLSLFIFSKNFMTRNLGIVIKKNSLKDPRLTNVFKDCIREDELKFI